MQDAIADKPGKLFDENVEIHVLGQIHPFASRGGLKLDHALEQFRIDVEGKIALDIGSSTGGFTDCLLQKGAAKVYAVDVGYGQLDWKLRKDERVICLDRTNARNLKREDLGDDPQLVVVDVSFISLRLIFPALFAILKEQGDLVALVKPQFEVGKDEIENKGIIKDPIKRTNVLLRLYKFISEKSWVLRHLTESPIQGQKGNREYLIHCTHTGVSLDEEDIRKVVVD
ncbi:TlyA family RNA methyltransferase [bacterium AH-315-C08]|nr:TlyA family RNA methyltransferase [bacterium AH-315-C08]